MDTGEERKLSNFLVTYDERRLDTKIYAFRSLEDMKAILGSNTLYNIKSIPLKDQFLKPIPTIFAGINTVIFREEPFIAGEIHVIALASDSGTLVFYSNSVKALNRKIEKGVIYYEG